jgi:D-methionine transport system ATP-binding protein
MIDIQNLTKSYGEHVVLSGIDMHVEAGEIFGIVGHSGAGKSTLLRCLNGLEGYQGGSLKVMGNEVKDLTQPELMRLRSRMGMIFQNFNLMARRSVFENVAFPLEIWKHPKAEIRERVMTLLELVGLENKRDARPASLSGGQKQRVGIARALALKPDILLCDEATSALDPRTTQSILDLLDDINARLGLTIILVTHQMEAVKRLCRRTLLLDGGVPQGIGETAELFLSPTPNLKRLIDDDCALIHGGVNIRLRFPRERSQKHVITTMAHELGIDFSVVGGRLERYRNDMLGFLIINVEAADLEKTLAYLRTKDVHWQLMEDDER